MLPRRTHAPRRIEIVTGEPTYPVTAQACPPPAAPHLPPPKKFSFTHSSLAPPLENLLRGPYTLSKDVRDKESLAPVKN